jgi:hypothetical protein
MPPARLEVLTWVLIYSGLLLAALGAFLIEGRPLLGWVLVAAGLADTAVGFVLIWIRSRMKSSS